MPELQGISTFPVENSITGIHFNRGRFNKIKELFGKVIIQISKAYRDLFWAQETMSFQELN